MVEGGGDGVVGSVVLELEVVVLEGKFGGVKVLVMMMVSVGMVVSSMVFVGLLKVL